MIERSLRSLFVRFHGCAEDCLKVFEDDGIMFTGKSTQPEKGRTWVREDGEAKKVRQGHSLQSKPEAGRSRVSMVRVSLFHTRSAHDPTLIYQDFTESQRDYDSPFQHHQIIPRAGASLKTRTANISQEFAALSARSAGIEWPVQVGLGLRRHARASNVIKLPVLMIPIDAH